MILATLTEPATPESEGPAASNPVQTATEPGSLAAGTSAHGRENPIVTNEAKPETACTEETGAGTSRVDPWAGVEARVAARQATSAWRHHEAARQALQRAHEIAAADPERGWGLGRLREAWVVFRFGARLREAFETPQSGPERVGDHGTGDAGPSRPGQLRRASDAIALYEAFAEQRPPGWPAAGAGALCVLAAQERAATLEGDIARLRCLAKDMRAAALHADPSASSAPAGAPRGAPRPRRPAARPARRGSRSARPGRAGGRDLRRPSCGG